MYVYCRISRTIVKNNFIFLDGTTATDDSDASGGIMRSSSAIDLVRGAANTTRAVPAPSANNVPASRANYYSLRKSNNRFTFELSFENFFFFNCQYL